jgi:hypothetical protein
MSGVNWKITPDDAARVCSDGVLHEVWWDTQDSNNLGYAYRASGDRINESGPLDATSLAEAITEYEELAIAHRELWAAGPCKAPDPVPRRVTI